MPIFTSFMFPWWGNHERTNQGITDDIALSSSTKWFGVRDAWYHMYDNKRTHDALSVVGSK